MCRRRLSVLAAVLVILVVQSLAAVQTQEPPAQLSDGTEDDAAAPTSPMAGGAGATMLQYSDGSVQHAIEGTTTDAIVPEPQTGVPAQIQSQSALAGDEQLPQEHSSTAHPAATLLSEQHQVGSADQEPSALGQQQEQEGAVESLPLPAQNFVDGRGEQQAADAEMTPELGAASPSGSSTADVDDVTSEVGGDDTDAAAQLAAAQAEQAAEAERQARLEDADYELEAAEDLVGWAADATHVDVPRGIAGLEAMLARLEELVPAAVDDSTAPREPSQEAPPPAPPRGEADNSWAGSLVNATAGNATDSSSQQQEHQQAAEEQASEQGAAHSAPGLDMSLHPELVPLSDAAFTLASLLASGIAAAHGLPRNDTRALHVLRRAAAAGSLEAKLALADRHLQGRGVPRDVDEGLRYAKEVTPDLLAALDDAGTLSSSNGGGGLRLRFIDASYQPDAAGWDDANALHYEQALAAKGDVEAHRQLGYRMLTGQGMPQDLAGAYREFEIAAQGGDAYAQFNAGYMAIRGMHVPQNFTAAREHFMRAAEKQLPAALNGLGVLYFHGQGVPVNYTEALRYFAAAADQDHDAAYNLAIMYQGGYGVERDMAAALRLLRNATDLGSWRAPHQLYLVLADGLFGAPKNTTEATSVFYYFMELTNAWRDTGKEAAERYAEGDAWGAAVRYALLAEQGSPTAMLNLAWLLHRGEAHAGPDRHALALPLWLRAAKHNHSEGSLLAGHAYFDGDRLGLPGGANVTAAVEMYQRAAAAGSIEGLFTLGRLREQGLGLERNTAEAARLYRQAMRRAPTRAFATAPFLALHWLRLRLLLAPLGRLLSALLLVNGSAPAANGHAAPAAEPLAQQQLRRRTPGLPVAAQWDTLLIAAMVGALTWVLWRRRQLQQRTGAQAAQQQRQQQRQQQHQQEAARLEPREQQERQDGVAPVAA